MIVVKVELWPYGYSEYKRELGRMSIANDGTGTRTVGQYDSRLYGNGGRSMGQTRVTSWPRLQKHVWDLVLVCLRQLREGKDDGPEDTQTPEYDPAWGGGDPLRNI